ncbi:hypothetical protein C0V77_14690 [Emticicia sp. TH156]|nr:hypothetical protein C0V77_14690 [Emticicia sp. TH156]
MSGIFMVADLMLLQSKKLYLQKKRFFEAGLGLKFHTMSSQTRKIGNFYNCQKAKLTAIF